MQAHPYLSSTTTLSPEARRCTFDGAHVDLFDGYSCALCRCILFYFSLLQASTALTTRSSKFAWGRTPSACVRAVLIRTLHRCTPLTVFTVAGTTRSHPSSWSRACSELFPLSSPPIFHCSNTHSVAKLTTSINTMLISCKSNHPAVLVSLSSRKNRAGACIASCVLAAATRKTAVQIQNLLCCMVLQESVVMTHKIVAEASRVQRAVHRKNLAENCPTNH